MKNASAVVVANWLRAFSFCVVVSFMWTQSFCQPVLLGDLNEGEELTRNEYSLLTAGHDRVYFVGRSNELWTSSKENPEDLVMLRKFSSLSDLTVVGATLYFAGNGELWKTKGTVESTVLVKDIRPGYGGGWPEQLTNVRGTLYFVANDGIHGKELWKSNGSPAGTVMVKDIMPRGGNSNPTELTAVGTTLFFSAKDATHGTELWKTNGTATGTFMVKDIRTGTGVNSTPSDLVNVYGTLFFVAADPIAGRELWKSDGTASGTVLVKDIAPGSGSSRIDNGTAVYRTLFFTATDGIHGQELWKSDGTLAGTVMVKDMTPGPEGSQGEHPYGFEMGNFTNIYGTLFYTAYQDDTYYIWKTNGTPNTTIPIIEVFEASASGGRPEFTFLNGRVYYFNGSAQSGQSIFLMSMDPKGSNHEQVFEFVQGDYYDPYDTDLALVGSTLYLTGRPGEAFGYKMVISDGTTAGTKWIEDIRTETEGSIPRRFVTLNGKLYFLSTNYSFYENPKLYVTDGTPHGTEYVLTFPEQVGYLEAVGNTLYATSNQSYAVYRVDLEKREVVTIMQLQDRWHILRFADAAGHLFFSSTDGELWTSNGTPGGNTLLGDFRSVHALYPRGKDVLFTIRTDNAGLELWRTDGTVAGTARVKIIRSGAGIDSNYKPHALVENILYFLADDGVHGSELWRSDGTLGGTYMVKDLNTHDLNTSDVADIRTLMLLRNELYFSALGDDGNWGLFKSDGTAAGTKLVENLDLVLKSIPLLGNRFLLFILDRSEPWTNVDVAVTDGSAEGTEIVADLNSVPYYNMHQAVVDGVAYFSFNNGEFWRSDVTECGTFMVNLEPHHPTPFGAVEDILVFGSYDSQVGFELYGYDTSDAPVSPCSRAVGTADTSAFSVEESVFPAYPNPFKSDFSFSAPRGGGEATRLQVFTLYGELVEDIRDMKPNTEHRFGESWPKGIYVLQVIREGVVERYRVVKE